MRVDKTRVFLAFIIALVLCCLPKATKPEILWADEDGKTKKLELTCEEMAVTRKQAVDLYKTMMFAAPECTQVTPQEEPECLTHFFVVLHLNNLWEKMGYEMTIKGCENID